MGLITALGLTFLSVVRVSSDGLAYRKPETWSNASTLVLSEPTFSEGRSELPPNAQPDRFAGLVDQYAALVTSDEVISSLKRQELLKADAGDIEPLPISGTAVPSAITGAATPLLRITAEAPTRALATSLAIRTTDTFIRFVKSRQDAANIPADQRIELKIVTRAGVPQLTGPRSKTTPIIIFLAGMTIVVASAFIRDNLQRQRDQKDRSHHELATAPVLDPVIDALKSTRDSAQTDADAVFGTDQAATRSMDAEAAADVGPVIIPRRSSGSSR